MYVTLLIKIDPQGFYRQSAPLRKVAAIVTGNVISDQLWHKKSSFPITLAPNVVTSDHLPPEVVTSDHLGTRSRHFRSQGHQKQSFPISSAQEVVISDHLGTSGNDNFWCQGAWK